MPHYCAAVNCYNLSNKVRLSFFRFPKEVDRHSSVHFETPDIYKNMFCPWISMFLSTLCLLAVQRVGYCYDPVCLSVCPHKTRNCEETERRTKKVLEIKVVGYDDSYSGVPLVVTSDDI
jgi:hypothetical protein